jgi:hypothetical protein
VVQDGTRFALLEDDDTCEALLAGAIWAYNAGGSLEGGTPRKPVRSWATCGWAATTQTSDRQVRRIMKGKVRDEIVF